LGGLPIAKVNIGKEDDETVATETRLPNDQWDGGWVEADNEWKPRPRTRVVGDIEWLARMSDKARAEAKGTIGAYIYPCPADKRLLAALELDPDTFQRIATSAKNDEELVKGVREASPTIKSGAFSYSIERR
jgi:hypothetical protein